MFYRHLLRMRSYWSLKLSNLIGVTFFLLFLTPLFAQFSNPEKEIRGKDEKYLFPIKPGQPASLAGTMGELRNTHFHSGIDIRTNNEIGWPVLASKSGYVSRISISSGGYGNVMYVKHPDGNTTLYGHLDRFNNEIESYVLKERYKRKVSEIDLYFRDTQFRVKQGDTIAFAGNTGSSGGPHLHFDIRDSNFDALDPQKFGFKEIRDVTAPVAQKIALKTLDIHSRVNDQFGRFEFYVTKNGNDYAFPAPILANGKIGIEILAFDRVDTFRFRTGINYIEVYVDGELTFCQTIEKIDISETRNIYNLIDYKALKSNGSKFYKLYLDDGSRQKFYSKSPTDGIVNIHTNNKTGVKIVLKDIEGNTSTVSFTLQPSNPTSEIITFEAAKIPLDYDFQENTLAITTQPCEPNVATVFQAGVPKTITPAYTSSKKVVYLLDLKKSIPDSITACNQSWVTHLRTMVPSEIEYRYYSDWVDIRFPNKSLYDTLYLQTQHWIQLDDSLEIFSIGTPNVPLHKSIQVTLKPSLTYPTTQQVSVYRRSGKSYAYQGGVWSNGKINFYTRELGEFVVLKDVTPPVITRLYVNNQVARFKIRDDLSGIANWEATINGKWLLMNFDAKTGVLKSEQLNDKELLSGKFELTVTDLAGNKQTYQQVIP
jgi:murein DD-endopeptidase MepM/ murein hydrolase activator NlpD